MADKTKSSKTIPQLLADIIAKPVQKLHAWGSESWWKSLIVIVIVGGAGALANNQFGEDNPVSNVLEGPSTVIVTDPSATVIVPPASISPSN